jgi:hypothetical protein
MANVEDQSVTARVTKFGNQPMTIFGKLSPDHILSFLVPPSDPLRKKRGVSFLLNAPRTGGMARLIDGCAVVAGHGCRTRR